MLASRFWVFIMLLLDQTENEGVMPPGDHSLVDSKVKK